MIEWARRYYLMREWRDSDDAWWCHICRTRKQQEREAALTVVK